MFVSDFDYSLPDSAIAQKPLERRTDSKLLVLGVDGGIVDQSMNDFPGLLHPGDLLVLNDTKVVPARLFGRKESGGRVEILLERVLGENTALVQARSSKNLRDGAQIFFADDNEITVIGRQDSFYKVESKGAHSLLALFEHLGHTPLPPYVTREDNAEDSERYQTVYARHSGAVAAPTAGLHFDQDLIGLIRQSGVSIGYLTLHVGAGTFTPVRCEKLDSHKMHSEYIEISRDLVRQIEACHTNGGRVVAVGTTTVRALESSAGEAGRLQPFTGDTNLFIYPGFEFKVVDALLTNFHLPRSTLLMMVCAFGGYQPVMRSYQHAIESNYRFYSYGDAMFLQRQMG